MNPVRTLLFFIVPALIVTAGHVREAKACACCADDGLRIETTEALRADDKTELDRIRFSPAARLLVTPGEPEDYAKGIRDPSDRYTVTVTRKADQWTFSLRDGKGKTGSLAFSFPKTMERFSIDLRDGKQTGGGGPLLYKEIRFRAPVTGTGVFEPGTSGGSATVRLVLQGRGNVCTEAEQFTHWTLVVSGPKASYTLFGALATPAKRP